MDDETSDPRGPCVVCGAKATGAIGRASYCSEHFDQAHADLNAAIREGRDWPGPGLRR